VGHIFALLMSALHVGDHLPEGRCIMVHFLRLQSSFCLLDMLRTTVPQRSTGDQVDHIGRCTDLGLLYLRFTFSFLLHRRLSVLRTDSVHETLFIH